MAATSNLNFFVYGNLGHDAGVGADGCLIGALTATDPLKGILKSAARACLCIAEDQGGDTYTTYTTEANEDTADDVVALPATPAVHDALYIGHATVQGKGADVNLSTAGAGTWTVTWEYSKNDGTWAALAGVTDGTTGFKATAGVKQVTWTVPTDWGKALVNNVYGYWVRARVSAYSSVTTQPLVGQIWWVSNTASEAYTDDTAALVEATANDVELLPAHVCIGDAFHIGGMEAAFCKAKATIGTAKAGGTGTYRWEYWNGTTWAALTCQDDTTLLTATAGTNFVSFNPPSDWVANTAGNGPNGEAGYFIRFACTAITVQPTTIPLGTRAYVYPVNVGSGIPIPDAVTIDRVSMNAQTASASNADTKLLIVNVTQGTYDLATWTKADACDTDATVSLAFVADEELAIVQVGEDGTTEFANANIVLHAA